MCTSISITDVVNMLQVCTGLVIDNMKRLTVSVIIVIILGSFCIFNSALIHACKLIHVHNTTLNTPAVTVTVRLLL